MCDVFSIEIHAYAGWQPRWFVLNDGVLSYYKSLEEVGQGCKGSINVASCEIQLHSTDTNRLDLSIPGEQVAKLPGGCSWAGNLKALLAAHLRSRRD